MDPEHAVDVITRVQAAIRRFLSSIQLQRVEVQGRVKERQKARAKLLTNEHFVDGAEHSFDLLAKLPNMTFESAWSAFNAAPTHKKPALSKAVIEHNQTLARCVSPFATAGAPRVCTQVEMAHRAELLNLASTAILQVGPSRIPGTADRCCGHVEPC